MRDDPGQRHATNPPLVLPTNTQLALVDLASTKQGHEVVLLEVVVASLLEAPRQVLVEAQVQAAYVVHTAEAAGTPAPWTFGYVLVALACPALGVSVCACASHGQNGKNDSRTHFGICLSDESSIDYIVPRSGPENLKMANLLA